METPKAGNSADAIVDRLKEALEIPSDGELARFLGVGKMTVSNWRSRNSRPYPYCLRIAEERGLSLDWLLTGEGEMYRGGVAPPAVQPDGEVREEATAYAPAAPLPPEECACIETQHGPRVAALLGVLNDLTPEDRSAILDAALSRATAAKRLADLERAVLESSTAPTKKAG